MCGVENKMKTFKQLLFLILLVISIPIACLMALYYIFECIMIPTICWFITGKDIRSRPYIKNNGLYGAYIDLITTIRYKLTLE